MPETGKLPKTATSSPMLPRLEMLTSTRPSGTSDLTIAAQNTASCWKEAGWNAHQHSKLPTNGKGQNAASLKTVGCRAQLATNYCMNILDRLRLCCAEHVCKQYCGSTWQNPRSNRSTVVTGSLGFRIRWMKCRTYKEFCCFSRVQPLSSTYNALNATFWRKLRSAEVLP